MKKADGRALSHEALEAIRIRAVRQVELGESPEEVIKTLGFARACIYNWIALYREGGEEALRAKPVPGRPPKLDGRQLQWLCRTIADKTPLQFKFEYALWTREMVRELIRERCGVKLSGVSVGRLLHKLGFSPQRPLHRAYEQDPAAVERWRRKDFPKIRSLAKAQKAEIFFGDEAGVRSDYHAGTTWGAKGVTPVVTAAGARVSVNLVSAISARGNMRFMLVPGEYGAVDHLDHVHVTGATDIDGSPDPWDTGLVAVRSRFEVVGGPGGTPLLRDGIIGIDAFECRLYSPASDVAWPAVSIGGARFEGAQRGVVLRECDAQVADNRLVSNEEGIVVTSFEDSLTTIEVNDVLAGATGRVGVYFDPFGLPVLPPSNPAPDVYTLLNDLEGFSASNQYGFQFIPSFCGATLPVGLFARYNYWGCAEWSQPPHAGGPVADCWLPPPSAGAGCSRVTRLVDTIPPSHAPFIP